MAANHLTQEEIEALPSVRTPTTNPGRPRIRGWGMGKAQEKWGDFMAFHGDFNGIYWDFIGFHGDFMGFHG